MNTGLLHFHAEGFHFSYMYFGFFLDLLGTHRSSPPIERSRRLNRGALMGEIEREDNSLKE